MKTYTYYSDPGHGWLAVNRADVQDVGLTPSMFSPCSYMKDDTLYLEEDCDAGLFVAAYRAKHGRAPAYVEKGCNSDSPIRNYKRLSGSDYSYDLWQQRMNELRRKAA